jgi:hypothetical protein
VIVVNFIEKPAGFSFGADYAGFNPRGRADVRIEAATFAPARPL